MFLNVTPTSVQMVACQMEGMKPVMRNKLTLGLGNDFKRYIFTPKLVSDNIILIINM